MKAWKNNCEDGEFNDIIEFNMDRMFRLNKSDKNAINILMNEFNIENFGRYPTRILLHQIRNIKNKNNEYGIMVSDKGDYNGHAYTANFYNDINKAYETINNLGYVFRLYEISDKIELAKILMENNMKYDKKISFMIVTAHGSEESIRLSRDEKDKSRFDIKQIVDNGDRFKKYKKFFKDDAEIIFYACSVGAKMV